MGITILVMFSQLFTFLNNSLHFAGDTQLALGLWTVILAHISFMIPFVTLVVQARLQGLDKSYEEAAMDLGANEWITFQTRDISDDFPRHPFRRITGFYTFHRRLYYHLFHEWTRLHNAPDIRLRPLATRDHSAIECPFHGLDIDRASSGFPDSACGRTSELTSYFAPNQIDNV